MKKRIAFLLMGLAVLGVAFGLLGCTPSKKTMFESIINAVNYPIYAIDSDVKIVTTEAGNTISEKSVEMKLVANENKQELISIKNLNGQSIDTYFSDGIVYRKFHDGSTFIYEDNLERVMSDNTIDVSINLDSLYKDGKITRKRDYQYIKYTITYEGWLSDVFGTLIESVVDHGTANMIVSVDRSTGSLKKMEVTLNYGSSGSEIITVYTVNVNARNSKVKLKFPNEINQKFDNFYTRHTLNIVCQPFGVGYFEGNGGDYSGNYFDIAACNTSDSALLRGGVSIKLMAFADEGYIFDGWFFDGEIFDKYHFLNYEMPFESTTLEARFIPAGEDYLVSMEVSGSEYGHVSNSTRNGCATDGETVVVEANTYWENAFIGWYIDGVRISGEPTYVFVMPPHDVSLEARFGKYYENYENTADGAVKYYDIGFYKDAVYDAAINKLAVLRNETVDIYSVDTMQKLKTFEFSYNPSAIDIENGILAVGVEGPEIQLYDITAHNAEEFIQLRKIWTSWQVRDLVLDGNVLICSDSFYLTFYNILDGKILKQINDVVANAELTVNRDDHILYASDMNKTWKILFYFDSQTGEILYQSDEDFYSYDPMPFYDGRYFHFCGFLFNKLSGKLIEKHGINENYPSTEDFLPSLTLYDKNGLAFVFGTDDKNAYVAVYENIIGEYLCFFSFAAASLDAIDQNKFISTNINGNMVAIIDLSLVTK